MLNEIYQGLDPIAIHIGSISIAWYGLAYLAGFIFGSIIMYKTAKKWHLDLTADDILTIITGIAFGVIVGGRLGYVTFYGAGYYLAHPAHIFMISEGGMSFHGGLVGAVVGGVIACKAIKVDPRTVIDLGVIAAPLGLFFGRCANFVNGELWGAPTDLPWGVMFETGGNVYRHPSQLYEAILEGLLILIVMLIVASKRPVKPQGTFLGIFLVMYGIARILIEFVRVPDAQLGYLFGFVTMGQLLSLPLVILGIIELRLSYKRQWPQQGHSR